MQLQEIPSEVHVCTSESSQIWIPILAVYKGVELVFSLIFAFETRKVKVKELNDSRMVIFSVYTIVVTAIAVAPVLAFLAEEATIKYAIAGIICLASSTLLLGMNFIPKVGLTVYGRRMHYTLLKVKPMLETNRLPDQCDVLCTVEPLHNITLGSVPI